MSAFLVAQGNCQEPISLFYFDGKKMLICCYRFKLDVQMHCSIICVHRMRPECTQNAPRMYTECAQNVHRMRPECTQNVPRMYTECAQNVHRMRPECPQNAPRMYPQNAPRMYTECAQNVDRMRPECTQIVHRMYTECAQNVHRMRPECTQNVPRMYTECAQNVHRMRPECTQNAHRMYLLQYSVAPQRLFIYPNSVLPLISSCGRSFQSAPLLKTLSQANTCLPHSFIQT